MSDIEAVRRAIIAGLKSYESNTSDFSLSSGMRQDIADHIIGQPGALPALLDRIDALEAALRPFAERCDETVRPSDEDDSGVTVRTRHLRAARAALRETPR